MAKPWFMFTKENNDRLFDNEGFIVPFGNPNFDSGLGGSHDLDIPAPPNYPVTALLPGKIISITKPPPDWGEQIGVELDEKFNGIPFMAYLHLSAVNQDLAVGQPISKDHIIGWTGGANNETQYAGTRNPTGRNFTNPAFHSSQVQVGVALMRGKEYGITHFNKWPPIEKELDPSQIIYNARKAYLQGIDLTNLAVARFFSNLGNDVWKCNQTGFVVGHGILNFYRHFGGDALCGLTYLGLPLSNEIAIAGHAGIVKQAFERAIVAWDPNHQVDSPPGAGKAYLMHLPK
jgi:hypothetical protein